MQQTILQLRQILGVKSDEKVARAIGVALGTVAKWKSGDRYPSQLAQNKINELLATKKTSKGVK